MITSNIHFGLLGWSNATYAIGARRYNSANAYQVTTGGTSTSPPSGTGTNINNGGTAVWKWLSAIDYTAPGDWSAALAGTTLTQPVVGLVWNNGTITATLDTPLIEFKNIVTTSINTITLKPAPGESLRDAVATTAALNFDATKGVSITLPATTTAGNRYVIIGTANTTIQGIQFKDPLSTSLSQLLTIGNRFSSQTADNVLVADCLFDGYGQANGSGEMINYDAGCGAISFVNNVLIDRGTGANVRTFVQSASALTMLNNTLVAVAAQSGTTEGFANDATGGTTTFRNNITIGWQAASVLMAFNANAIAVDNSIFSVGSLTASNVTTGTNVLFSKTAANQFVSTTNDFRLKAGSAAIGAGVVDTTHNPAGDDFAGRARGTTWDIGAYKMLAGTVIFRDVVSSIAFATTVVRDLGTSGGSPWSTDFSSDFGPVSPASGIPLEWNIGQRIPQQDSSFPIEWRVSVFRDRGFDSEWRSSLTIDQPVPSEWASGTRSVTNDVGCPLEWRTSFSADQTPPAEWGSARSVDGAMPVVWQRSLSVDGRAPLEFNGAAGITVDASVPIEWRAPLIITNAAMSLEWKASSVVDSAAPVAFSLAVVQTMPLTLETTALRLVDASVPLEATALGTVDMIGSVAWSNSVTLDTRLPVEAGLAVSRAATAPIEYSAAISADTTLQAAYTLNLLRDAPLPLEALASRVADARAPLELGGAAALTSDATMPLEWRSTIFQDASVPIDGQSVFGANTVFALETSFAHVFDTGFGLAWLAGLAGAVSVPVEWAQVTLSLSVDTAFPLEFKTTVAADITIPIADDRGRRAIGSSIEPDEFEDEHEPDSG